MKICLPFMVCIICSNLYAQKAEQYYDYQWKPCSPAQARFLSLTNNTDSGWLRQDYFLATRKLQMKGLYEDSATHIANGQFYFYYPNGVPESIGRNVHNKREGLWLKFYHTGIMEDSTVYENGSPAGTSIGWHQNGYQSDSIVYNKDGSSVEVNWFDTGMPASSGRKKYGKNYGPWNYFNKDGKLSALEVYDEGNLISRHYYNEEGVQESDTTSKNREAMFTGGQEGWKKFIMKHIYFPDQYKLVNTTAITVVVTAIIAEDGTVTEPWVEVPFNKAFDDIAVAIFKKSPKWIPAVRYNRTVKQGVRQPITFSQGE
ncbi:MAG: hypothetical protein ABI416_10695 [Ginsengibacter sp.]